MRYLLALVWLIVSLLWASAFMTLSSMTGGVRWLAHMGQAFPATMNVALSIACLSAALTLTVRRSLPRLMLFALLGLSVLHLVNGVGAYLLASTNGHIGAIAPLLWYPLALVGIAAPTNPVFMKGLVGNWQLLALPIATCLLTLVCFAMRSLVLGPRSEA